jgi:ATP-dependent exoDNAse (exonuclease V) beta subunit
MNKNFIVYKSSAGSGKTTTLVKEYLKLSLKNPAGFKNILAITFTNKAANEMKSRILESLKEMAAGKVTDTYKDIALEVGLTATQLSKRAAILLSMIIHQYDAFAVSTIDSFIHQIVRTFSSDLKLPQGFEVLIDNDDLIPFIVEDMYDKLGYDTAFTNILIHFVMSQVADEKNYDLTHQLATFVKKQLDEQDPLSAGVTQNFSPEDFLMRINNLLSALQSTKAGIRKLAHDSLKTIEETGLAPGDFFHGKSGVGNYFMRLSRWPAKLKELLPNSYVMKALEQDLWYAASAHGDVKARIDGIAPVLKKNLLTIREKLSHYFVRKIVYDNIYEMALIGEIQQLFEAFTDRTHKVHISEFNKRIHREIAGQPVPFIYERLGRRYTHFLIDEFQDTSVLQWNNLLPLIEESLSNGHFNMVVGDAKQAIYRFRHGEVELFTNLPKLYGVPPTPENKLREQLLEQHFLAKNLQINYRSREEIIRFNNDFFRFSGQKLSEDFQTVYHDVEQELPSPAKPEGYVSIDLIPAGSADDFRSKRLPKIWEKIIALRDTGYPMKDICVLTLQNSSASEIAGYLLQNSLPVITSESLLLSTSPEVRMAIAYMHLLVKNDHKLFFAEFLLNLLRIRHHEEDFHRLFADASLREHPVEYILENFALSMPSSEVLRARNVYEIASEIFRNLTPQTKPNPFVSYFLDFIFEKEVAYNGSLPAFLELWEEKKWKQSIVLPEGMDAVRVMTVHKAKGLKFGVVIADLHDMNQRLTREQYWEDLQLPELEGVSSVLLNISENLTYIEKEKVFRHEKAKTELDFLNKVYVAFTRAVDGLMILGSAIEKNSKDRFAAYLADYLKSKALPEPDSLHSAWGELPASENEAETATQESVTVLSQSFDTPWYEYLSVAPAEEIFWEAMGQNAPQTYGKMVHAILSKIRQADEAPHQVAAWQHAGLLTEEEASGINRLLQQVLTHPALKKYYTGDVVVKTETDLYDITKGKFQRPDRVILDHNKLTILDYKTGERDSKTEQKYRKQVSDYATIFERMGYNDIEKKLVYLHGGAVEIVNV